MPGRGSGLERLFTDERPLVEAGLVASSGLSVPSAQDAAGCDGSAGAPEASAGAPSEPAPALGEAPP
jgi:hypothetical protein